jgi:hypothetical protein
MMASNPPAWLSNPHYSLLSLLSQTDAPAQIIGTLNILTQALSQNPHLLPTIVSLVQSLLSSNITPAGIVDAGVAVEIVVMCLDMVGGGGLLVEPEDDHESLDLIASGDDEEEDMVIDDVFKGNGEAFIELLDEDHDERFTNDIGQQDEVKYNGNSSAELPKASGYDKEDDMLIDDVVKGNGEAVIELLEESDQDERVTIDLGQQDKRKDDEEASAEHLKVHHEEELEERANLGGLQEKVATSKLATSTDPSPSTSKSTTPILTKKKRTGKLFVNHVKLPSHNFTNIVLSSDDEDSDKEHDVHSKLKEKEMEIKRVMELIEQKQRAEKKKTESKKKESAEAKSLPDAESDIQDGVMMLIELEKQSNGLQIDIMGASSSLAIAERVFRCN